MSLIIASDEAPPKSPVKDDQPKSPSKTAASHAKNGIY
jgi:hypothetical protein